MAEPEVKVRIKAKDDASPVVEKVEGRFTKLAGFLKARFVITLGDVQRAISTVTGAIGDVVGAAQEQENAVNSLNAALGKLGPSSAGVSKALQEQAASLQKTTKYGDEAIIQAQAMLATLGVQADQLPKATQATVDLAAAMGISLESAARNVGKTVGGFAGELGEVIPELKGLSAEALKSGAGIDILGQKFAGRATQDAKTFSGVMSQLGNAFGDLKERVGQALTNNEGFRNSVSKITSIISSENFVNTIGAIADGMAKLASWALEAAVGIQKATVAVVGWFGKLKNLIPGLQEANAETERQAEVAAAAAEEMERLTTATEAHTSAVERAKRIEQEFNSALEEMRSLAKEFGVSLEKDVNAQLEKNEQALIKAEIAARQGVITWQDYEAISAAMAETNTGLTESITGLAAATEEAAGSMDNYVTSTDRATLAQQKLGEQAKNTSDILSSGTNKDPLFRGLSGASYNVTVPVTPDQLTFTGSGYVYKGQRVKVLPDGRVEFA